MKKAHCLFVLRRRLWHVRSPQESCIAALRADALEAPPGGLMKDVGGPGFDAEVLVPGCHPAEL